MIRRGVQEHIFEIRTSIQLFRELLCVQHVDTEEVGTVDEQAMNNRRTADLSNDLLRSLSWRVWPKLQDEVARHDSSRGRGNRSRRRATRRRTVCCCQAPSK